MTFKHSTMLDVTAPLLASTAFVDVKIGFIGSPSSGAGLNILRGAEIAIEEVNTAGGMSGEKFVLVSTDVSEDVIEGVRAYEYLAKTEEADFTISGSINDVSLGQLPHMQEFQIPTSDIWISYIGIINMVIEDPKAMALCSMGITSNEALATLYISFGTDVLKKEMGWDSVVVLAEGTTFGEAITGLVTRASGPATEVETKEIITYDVGAVGFVPLFSKVQTPGAGFIHRAGLVSSQVTSLQYVKLQVPMAMTGVNAPALGLEYRENIGSAGGGISTPSPIPPVGFEFDPESQKFVDTYQAKYDSHPKMPHFNRFNTYQGPKQVAAVTGTAGGLDDAKAWSAEMREQNIMPKKDGRVWLRYALWGDDEVEEVTGQTYPHNARFDLTAPYDNTQPSMVVIQWKEGDGVDMVYPPEYVTTKFTAPSQVK